jgi:hypothetical protein
VTCDRLHELDIGACCDKTRNAGVPQIVEAVALPIEACTA